MYIYINYVYIGGDCQLGTFDTPGWYISSAAYTNYIEEEEDIHIGVEERRRRRSIDAPTGQRTCKSGSIMSKDIGCPVQCTYGLKQSVYDKFQTPYDSESEEPMPTVLQV